LEIEAIMEQVSIGKSSDRVFRLVDDEGKVSYLKIGGFRVQREHERLEWLSGKAQVAKIISFDEEDGEYRLVTEAVPGIMAHECEVSQREEVVKVIGRALKKLHSLPIEDCPFDNTIDVQLEEAAANTRDGLVDEDDFDPAHIGMKASELLPMLFAKKPTVFENVLTHGDYSVQNILIDPVTLEVNGLIDLGRCGISDRYLDLGIALNSLAHYIGEGYDIIFFEAYGIDEVDWSRIRFYQMLDEFF
jgi:aminoglycoside phosphotransferase